MRGVNQNGRPPFIWRSVPEGLKWNRWLFHFADYYWQDRSIMQNSNTASDFKVCVTIWEHLAAQNFVDRIGKQDSRLHIGLLQRMLLSGKRLQSHKVGWFGKCAKSGDLHRTLIVTLAVSGLSIFLHLQTVYTSYVPDVQVSVSTCSNTVGLQAMQRVWGVTTLGFYLRWHISGDVPKLHLQSSVINDGDPFQRKTSHRFLQM